MSTAAQSTRVAQIGVRVSAAEKIYPNGIRALKPIDLQVREGEFLTLLGPSGCGKSTLLRLIAGLTPPTSGSVEVTAGSAGPPRLAFVFQQPTLMPWASVARNVRLPLDLFGQGGPPGDERVRSALALVGLQDFATAYPRELSGGMQMRASIARALVNDPRLLLMDEPFGALDEITRARLDYELRALWHAAQLTIVFVTHSVYEAVFLSSRVLVMSPRPGRIVSELTIDEPHPRSDAFRLSGRFATLCKTLSEALARTSGDAD